MNDVHPEQNSGQEPAKLDLTNPEALTAWVAGARALLVHVVRGAQPAQGAFLAACRRRSYLWMTTIC